MEEMVGKRFGKLVIIEFEKRSPNVLSRCTCRCDCGNTIEIGLAALRKKTSCGCNYLDPRADITGKKYGKLTVESRVIESNVEAFAMKWKCRCDCGKEITATTLALQAGLIVSCGCTAAEEVTLDLANVNRGNIEKTNTHILQGALDGVMYENNKSGVRGVYFSNTYKNYWANIVFQGKRYNLGRYNTIEEAQKAREKAEEILYGSFLEHYEADLKPQIEAENERANIEGFESFVENLEPDKERTPFFTPGKYEEGLCQVCGKPVPKGRQKYCSNVWVENVYKNAFGQNKIIEMLLVAIPLEHQGALETILLDAIAEDPYDAHIIELTTSFVKMMRAEASKYISSDRKELKARLGVTWAVQYPEKIFKLINEQIKSVEWEKSEVLQKCFSELIKI